MADSPAEVPLHQCMQQRGNKQKELEATMILESYDLVALTET